MGATRFRALPAAVTGLGLVAALLAIAEPAAACSCIAPELDKVLAKGLVVGVVPRVDDGRGPRGTFEVHETVGGDLPAELTVDMRSGCGPGVLADGVAALAFERKASWKLGWCSELPVGPVLQRAGGAPDVTSRAPAVAVAAGRFGDSRLVALDRLGRPVAWDRRGGAGEAVAVCPGGKAVAALAETGDAGAYYPSGPTELTVHDARTLRPRRTVELRLHRRSEVLALRCVDPRGRGVEAVVVEHRGRSHAKLVSVTGTKVASVELPDVVAAAPVAGGFLAVVDHELVRLDADGGRRTLARFDDLAARLLAVSPDGRTAALYGGDSGNRGVLRTVDTRSGRAIGEWATDDGRNQYIPGLAWAGADRLLVRLDTGEDDRHPQLLVLDRRARELERGASAPGWRFRSVGESAVSLDSVPMRSATPGHAPLEMTELRLGAAKDVVSLSGARFSPGRSKSDVAVDVGGSVEVGDLDPGNPLGGVLLGALGATAAGGGALAAAAFVRRRRSDPT